MSEQMLAPEDQMMQWITSKWITKPIYVISELGIADLLCNGPLSVDSLAGKTDTPPPPFIDSSGLFHQLVFSLRQTIACLI
ncbi:hypothetical protein ACFL2S_09785 [Thermodesulfobacteriota bacterium]